MSELATTTFKSTEQAVERLLDAEMTTAVLATSADTLTVAETVNCICTIADGGAAVAITTPTGTEIWAGLKDPKIGDTFWLGIMNNDAADAKTLTAGASGVTILGTAAVAATKFGLFLARLTAANTVVFYGVQ
jgi:hypothetical protein